MSSWGTKKKGKELRISFLLQFWILLSVFSPLYIKKSGRVSYPV
uniref:Uncharacterized protein n=1 Tax=Arundo donax TaxID=35708 RepID=A0A0A9T531_ARUDO